VVVLLTLDIKSGQLAEKGELSKNCFSKSTQTERERGKPGATTPRLQEGMLQSGLNQRWREHTFKAASTRDLLRNTGAQGTLAELACWCVLFLGFLRGGYGIRRRTV
jgi:hypothetical protein